MKRSRRILARELVYSGGGIAPTRSFGGGSTTVLAAPRRMKFSARAYQSAQRRQTVTAPRRVDQKVGRTCPVAVARSSNVRGANPSVEPHCHKS